MYSAFRSEDKEALNREKPWDTDFRFNRGAKVTKTVLKLFKNSQSDQGGSRNYPRTLNTPLIVNIPSTAYVLFNYSQKSNA